MGNTKRRMAEAYSCRNSFATSVSLRAAGAASSTCMPSITPFDIESKQWLGRNKTRIVKINVTIPCTICLMGVRVTWWGHQRPVRLEGRMSRLEGGVSRLLTFAQQSCAPPKLRPVRRCNASSARLKTRNSPLHGWPSSMLYLFQISAT